MEPSSERERRLHLGLLGLVVVVALVHHCVLFWWYVDDAAITFAYARNVAMGEGVVPYVGAERVEGYSNPAWMFFLVPFAFVGLDLITVVRWLQPFLVAPTVVVTWLAAREAFAGLADAESDDGRGFRLVRHLPLVPPAILAVSTQFALWTGAGLEIALLDLFMALAIWRSLVELRTGEWPWSALLWLGVALSRPEAILYAAAAGFWAMVQQLRAGRGIGPTAKWLVTFFVPFGLYQAWRYQYFAWPLPNTFYAKVEQHPAQTSRTMVWSGRSWSYTRHFAHDMGWGYFLPVWGIGAIGHRGFRWPLAVSLSVLAAAVIAGGTVDERVLVMAMGFGVLALGWTALDRSGSRFGPRSFAIVLAVVLVAVGVAEGLRLAGIGLSPYPFPSDVRNLPPYVLTSFALVAFGVSLTDRRVPARSLVLSLCLAAVTFAVIAKWDWMKGYRWYAPAVVPGAMLFALGLHHLSVEVVGRITSPTARRSALAMGMWGMALAIAVPFNVLETADRVDAPDASPAGVRRRARYMLRAERTLHLEERVRDLEVDMGGHMYWTDFELVDIAGLVDVPMAQHRFQPRFIDEYIFEEQRPHFVHLHKAWERHSRIKTRPAWRSRTYIEIPPYSTGRWGLHDGNHVRRDLVLPATWPHGGEPVELEAGVRVHGIEIPSEPPAGGEVYLEVGVAQLDRAGQSDFRMWLTATRDDFVHRWDLAPGYGWIAPTEWMDDEVFVGRYSVPLPEGMEPGEYALSLVVVAEDGSMLGARGAAEDVPSIELGVLQVLSPEAGIAAAEDDLQAALDDAVTDRCEDAERSWFLARKHRVGDPGFEEEHGASVRRQLAECWAIRSADIPRDEKVAALIRARDHDHWAPTYRAAADVLASALYAEGLEARDAEDWDAAYRAFADAVAVDRSRSWARRYAEEARAERLELRGRAEQTTAAR